jgi:Ser/Thr protein kinase RdoA (MazF antagonist)
VELGRLMARLHNHASGWQPPEGFLRPHTGPDHVWQLVDKLSAGVGMGIIAPQDYAALRSLADAIGFLVARIDQASGNYGLIHNDLHTGNWLVRGKEIIPLDFSLCAYGYHLFDIAIAAGSAGSQRNELRRMFFDGYLEMRPLVEAYVRSVEAFFIISALGYYVFILPDASQHEWLYERIPRMVRTIGQKFLREEPFFFEAS